MGNSEAVRWMRRQMSQHNCWGPALPEMELPYPREWLGGTKTLEMEQRFSSCSEDQEPSQAHDEDAELIFVGVQHICHFRSCHKLGVLVLNIVPITNIFLVITRLLLILQDPTYMSPPQYPYKSWNNFHSLFHTRIS
ncbi:hypothetical protein A6R68_13313, partial [Neotoma lepida]